MTSQVLRSSQTVQADIDAVWGFFSSHRNLQRLTPRSMGFEIHAESPRTVHGAEFEYAVRPLFGVPMRWRSVIDAIDAPHGFTDIQAKGPYRSWRHEHRFTPTERGVRMDDTVEYEMPFGALGSLAHRLFVRSELEHVFSYRTNAIADIFEPAGDPTASPPSVVAVAGGTGFVGGEIARELRRRGRRVVVLSTSGESARGRLPDDIGIRRIDMDSEASLDRALSGVDELVISLAFPGMPVEQPKKGWTFEEVDARGTRHLISAAQRARAKRVVYVSGAGASHEAKRHWFRAKAVAEDAVRASGMGWTILRPTWVYGPGDVALNRFLGFARVLPFVPMTNLGRQQLAPIFVRDVASIAADSLVEDAAAERVFEIGGPETMSMREILQRSLDVAERRRIVLPGPAPLIKLAAWPMRFMPNPPLSADAVDFVNQPATVDNGPLLAAMPRTLTRLEDGLATYAAPDRSVVDISDGRAKELRPAA